MIVGTIGNSKLKITLDPEETVDFFAECDNLSCADPETRYSLRILLGLALTKTEFKLDSERLFVEMYPSASGGCIIYFTKTPHRQRYKRKKDAIFTFLLEFDNTENAITISKALCQKGVKIEKSSLYKYNNLYYLIVLSSFNKALNSAFITEFADSCTGSNTASAIVSEHGNVIIEQNAVEILSKI